MSRVFRVLLLLTMVLVTTALNVPVALATCTVDQYTDTPNGGSITTTTSGMSSGTVCLHDHANGGSVSSSYGATTLDAVHPPSGITITAASGESPVIDGDFTFSSTSSSVTLSSVRINGRATILGTGNTVSNDTVAPDQQNNCVDVTSWSTNATISGSIFEGCKTTTVNNQGSGTTQSNNWSEPNGWDTPPAGVGAPSLIYRPFQAPPASISIWNDAYNKICSSCTLASLSSGEATDLGGGSSTGTLTGVDSNQYSAPLFQSDNSNTAPLYCNHECGNPNGTISFTSGSNIPVPSGTAAATGSDGHLAILSSNLHDAWDMWQCLNKVGGGPCTESGVLASSSGYSAWTGVHWDLTSSGVEAATVGGGYKHSLSARESGLPLIDTSVRAHEALYGIHHALGISTHSASGNILYPPATHGNCDGPNPGSGTIRFGMLVVLNPSFTYSGSSIGWKHIIQALKTYGAYVQDNGSPTFEIDADYHSDRGDWSKTGLNTGSGNTTPFTVGDLRVISNGGSGELLPGQTDEGAEPSC
jgi:hypothetical protein